jgi:hypothetical protein
MTHDRPYKRAMSHDAAIRELRRHAGTQFDPDVVRLFCSLYARRPPVTDPAIVRMTMVRADDQAAATGLPSLLPPTDGGPPRRPRRRARDGSETSLG